MHPQGPGPHQLSWRHRAVDPYRGQRHQAAGTSISRLRARSRTGTLLPAFKADYAKQLAIYLDSFDDIQLAGRKERVKAIAGLYEKIPMSGWR